MVEQRTERAGGDEATWLRTTADLERALGQLGSGPLALDTEADSLHHYPEKVCLIQLTFAGRDWLLDPLADADPRALGPVLGDAGVTKILHGADYDLRMLHRQFGLTVKGLFDTMIAARLTGERAFGLAALLDSHFDVQLEKRFQRADWSKRPLTAEMEHYASMDTHWLEALALKLRTRLEELERTEWVEEEFSRLEQVRWTVREDPESFRRVKGSGALDARGLAVLREAWQFREKRARQVNRPPFRVLRDDSLLQLAKAAIDLGAAVSLLERWGGYWSREPGRSRLLSAVERALAVGEDQWPAPLRRERRRPSPGREKKLRELCQGRDVLAERLGIEPPVLASKAGVAEALDALERKESPDGSGPLRRWQARLLQPVFGS